MKPIKINSKPVEPVKVDSIIPVIKSKISYTDFCAYIEKYFLSVKKLG